MSITHLEYEEPVPAKRSSHQNNGSLKKILILGAIFVGIVIALAVTLPLILIKESDGTGKNFVQKHVSYVFKTKHFEVITFFTEPNTTEGPTFQCKRRRSRKFLCI